MLQHNLRTLRRHAGVMPARPAYARGASSITIRHVIPSCTLGSRWRLVCRASASRDPRHGHQQQEKLLTLTEEDISRQRLRFGQNPDLLDLALQHRQQDPGASSRPHNWAQLWEDTSQRLLYNYYNWRQDTGGDLKLVASAFWVLVLLGCVVKRLVVDDEGMRASTTWWDDMYQVSQWIFGQEFPPASAPVTQQAFAVVTAVWGLAAFALVLALVEQVVMELIQTHVMTGSPVYEDGHILILGWCRSQRDLEVVRKMLQQICVAYKPQGGTTVVVMTQRSKPEMEANFWRWLPAAQRHGTKLVFRQGSPLIPADLKEVSATQAAATIVLSDQGRSAAEADAQAVRAGILLDELDGQQGLCAAGPSRAGRHIVVELKTPNALPLLKYACSRRVIALPTGQLNAQRLAKMVKRPVISIVSQQLFNSENGVNTYVQHFAELGGCRFGDLARRFPDGIVMGTLDVVTGRARMVPARDYVLQSSDAIMFVRPTHIRVEDYRPLPPLAPDQANLQQLPTECSACQASDKAQCPLDGNRGPARGSKLPHTCPLADQAPDEAAPHSGVLGVLQPVLNSMMSMGGGNLARLLRGGGAGAAGARSSSSSSSGQHSAAATLPTLGGRKLVAMPHFVWSSGSSLDEPQEHGAAAAGEGAPAPLPAQADPAAATDVLIAQLSGRAPSALGAPHTNTSSSSGSSGGSSSSGSASGSSSSSSSSSSLGGVVTTDISPMNKGSGSSSAAGGSTRDAYSPGITPSRPASPAPPSSSSSSSSHPTSGTPATPLLSGALARAGSLLEGHPAASMNGVYMDERRQQLQQEEQHPAAGSGGNTASTGSSSSGDLMDSPDSSADHGEHPGGGLAAAWTSWIAPGLGGNGEEGGGGMSAAVARAFTGLGGGGAAPAGAGGGGSGVAAGGSSSARPVDATILIPQEYLQVDDHPEAMLVAGWGSADFMADLLRELDHGLSALPAGSEVVFVNSHAAADSLGVVLRSVTLENVMVRHVRANPLQRSDLGNKLDIERFRCALVLCDEQWVDPDLDENNGIDAMDEPDVLRLDALVMVTQLNIRKLLEDAALPPINIICQKVGGEGLTRFEDRHRLPLGISVNLNSYAAKLLTQVATNALMLAPVTRLGEEAHLTIVDASDYAAVGERVSFWELAERAAAQRDVLLGYYVIPEHPDEPLESIIDPIGNKVRCKRRTWNKGDGRRKLIVLRAKPHQACQSSCSYDDMELQNTQQARWLALDSVLGSSAGSMDSAVGQGGVGRAPGSGASRRGKGAAPRSSGRAESPVEPARR